VTPFDYNLGHEFFSHEAVVLHDRVIEVRCSVVATIFN